MNSKIRFYHFGEFRMTGTGADLEHNGERVNGIDGRPLQILHLLVDRAPATVSKAEFIDKIWRDPDGGKIHVGKLNVAVHISFLRRVLGSRLIQTIHRTGYRLTAHVTPEYEPDDTLLFLVPYAQNSYFTGREQLLKSIGDRFERAQHHRLFLSGPQGMGKTQAALAYAYRSKGFYKYILWFTCDDESILLSQYCSAAAPLGLGEATNVRQDVVREAVRLWIDRQSDWLIIFDNVENLAVLSDFLPRTKEGRILITTRSDDVPSSERERVGPLSGDEARTFLLSRIGRVADPAATEYEHLETLASEFGYLPLALEQAGAFMSATQISCGEYLRHFRENPTYLLSVEGRQASQYGTTLVKAIQLTVGRLSSAARDLLNAVSFCEPDEIPLELLSGMGLGDHLAPLGFELLVAELRDYSLVTLNVQRRTVSIHRLLKAIVSSILGAARSVLLTLLAGMHKGLPESPSRNWEEFERVLPHARAAFALAFKEAIDDAVVPAIAAKCGGYLIARGRYSEALSVLNDGIASAKRQWKDGHPTTALLLNALGNYNFYQAHFERAAHFYSEALEIRDRLLGATDPALGVSLNNLATVYLYQGRFSESEHLFARALSNRQSALGEFHPDVATTAGNLANLYHAQGKFGEADIMYSRALLIRQKADAYNELLTGWILTNHAELKFDRGEYESAQFVLTE